MSISNRLKKRIEEDLKTVIMVLRKRKEVIQRGLPNKIYDIYNTHESMEIKEEEKYLELEIVNTIKKIRQEFSGFYIESEESFWIKYYFFAKKKDDDIPDNALKALFSNAEMKRRIYLNPKISHFYQVMEKIIYIALKTPYRTDFMFKFPKHGNKDSLERCDKIVIYISLQSRYKEREFIKGAEQTVYNLESEIRNLPDSWFYDGIPLFTNKFAIGRARSISPMKKDNLFKEFLKRHKIKAPEYSYGSYISDVISEALFWSAEHMRLTKWSNIGDLDDVQIEKLYQISKEIVFRFVEKDIKEIDNYAGMEHGF